MLVALAQVLEGAAAVGLEAHIEGHRAAGAVALAVVGPTKVLLDELRGGARDEGRAAAARAEALILRENHALAADRALLVVAAVLSKGRLSGRGGSVGLPLGRRAMTVEVWYVVIAVA